MSPDQKEQAREIQRFSKRFKKCFPYITSTIHKYVTYSKIQFKKEALTSKNNIYNDLNSEFYSIELFAVFKMLDFNRINSKIKKKKKM